MNPLNPLPVTSALVFLIALAMVVGYARNKDLRLWVRGLSVTAWSIAALVNGASLAYEYREQAATEVSNVWVDSPEPVFGCIRFNGVDVAQSPAPRDGDVLVYDGSALRYGRPSDAAAMHTNGYDVHFNAQGVSACTQDRAGRCAYVQGGTLMVSGPEGVRPLVTVPLSERPAQNLDEKSVLMLGESLVIGGDITGGLSATAVTSVRAKEAPVHNVLTGGSWTVTNDGVLSPAVIPNSSVRAGGLWAQ